MQGQLVVPASEVKLDGPSGVVDLSADIVPQRNVTLQKDIPTNVLVEVGPENRTSAALCPLGDGKRLDTATGAGLHELACALEDLQIVGGHALAVAAKGGKAELVVPLGVVRPVQHVVELSS